MVASLGKQQSMYQATNSEYWQWAGENIVWLWTVILYVSSALQSACVTVIIKTNQWKEYKEKLRS